MQKNKTNAQMVRTRLFVGAMVATAVVGLTALGSQSWQERTYQREARRNAERTRKTAGLNAAARASEDRHYVSYVELDPEIVAADLDALTDVSAVIIRGFVKSNRTRVWRKPSGTETINTDYVVQVFDVEKGDWRLAGKNITVTIPGGYYQFPDNTVAEILTPGFRKPVSEEEYLMFLAPSDRPGTFTLAWGSQSLFALERNGTVRPTSRESLPVTEEAKGRDRHEFGSRIRGSVERLRRLGERR